MIIIIMIYSKLRGDRSVQTDGYFLSGLFKYVLPFSGHQALKG